MHLEINQVSKEYGRDFWALRDFSLKLGPGVVGLLGHNGAGKSTLMRILATITKPTRGTITWNGQDIVKQPQAIRRDLGYLPQDFGVYPNLSPQEFLEYLAAVKGLERRSARQRIGQLLELVNLTSLCKRPMGGFSGGQRQRVGIAQALLNDPKLLIVDEPTTGLDPGERLRFRNLLSELSGERIVILSTHIVPDIEAVASEIAIINKGSLIHHGSPEELLTLVQGRVWEWIVPSAELHRAKQDFLVTDTLRRPEGVQLRILGDTPPGDAAAPAVPRLEDAFLHLTRGGGAA